jgi:hypothetical protein
MMSMGSQDALTALETLADLSDFVVIMGYSPSSSSNVPLVCMVCWAWPAGERQAVHLAVALNLEG